MPTDLCTTAAGTAPPLAASPRLLQRALALAADPVPNVRLALARLLAGAVRENLALTPRDDAPAGPGTPPACGARSRWAASRADSSDEARWEALRESLEGLPPRGASAAEEGEGALAPVRMPIVAGEAGGADGTGVADGSGQIMAGRSVRGQACGCCHGDEHPVRGSGRDVAAGWVAGHLGEAACALERLARDGDRDVALMAHAGLDALAQFCELRQGGR